MLQIMVQLPLAIPVSTFIFKWLQGLCSRTENPCVGGSIPPEAT